MNNFVIKGNDDEEMKEKNVFSEFPKKDQTLSKYLKFRLKQNLLGLHFNMELFNSSVSTGLPTYSMKEHINYPQKM